MTSNAEVQTATSPASDDQVQVLLVEDDDGDAVLVGELLREVGAAVVVQRARSLTQAKDLVSGVACVLLDLGLPDSQGLNGLRQLLQLEPEAAIVVLTGQASEHLGEQAVRAGAQDYLVKGEVAGNMLNRVIRYAVERRRAEEAQRALHAAQIHAQENARLERGLLPSPLLADSRLSVSARCLPGGGNHLLGGDFYDVVESSDGWVHALIGDVCGRGPAEAALGVCLRVAWRTPVLVSRGGVAELPTRPGAPLGLSEVRDWPGIPIRLDGSWSILLYTDGLIEGRIGKGAERLGSESLMDLIRDALSGPDQPGEALLDQVIDRVRELNGGDLDDDLAVLALGFSSPADHD